MALTWHPMAIPALVVLAIAAALAMVVVAARPAARQNRRLAILLIHGATTTAFITGLRWLPTSEGHARIVFAVFITLAILIPFVYISFLTTLRTPLVRPFQRPRGMLVLGLLTLFFLGLWALRPHLFLADVVLVDFGGLGNLWENLPGPFFGPLALAAISTYLYGLVVAVSAYRRAATSTARAQAKAYAIAFGLRDGLTAGNVALVVLVFGISGPHRMFNDLGFPIIDAIFFILLSYGILKHQLFDIDHKIRFALSQSTVALAIGAAFFIGKEAVEAILPADGVLFGVLAALAVAAAFRPLQTFGWWVAEKIVPSVVDGDRRKLRGQEIYRAALEGAILDGTVTVRERAILDRVRQQVGLDLQVAEAMEREVLAAAAERLG